MKAIVQDQYCSTEDLDFRDVDVPEIGGDEVLVRVQAAGIDPGVWHIMRGVPYIIRLTRYGGLRAPKGRVRGREAAGVVDAVGKYVRRFQPGDEVFGFCEGAFAEYARAREDQLAPKPNNATFEQAAAAPVSGTVALEALRDQGSVLVGQHVLVNGAGGGIGTHAVQIAKSLGAKVTGVCSTPKVVLVRSLGADAVIDYTQVDFAGLGDRYDVIIDLAGNRPLGTLRRALTREGTLVIVGGEEGGPVFGGTGRSLRALLLTPFLRQKLRSFISKERNGDLRLLGEYIEAGDVTPVIDRTFPLPEAPEAIRYVEARHAMGKVVVTI